MRGTKEDPTIATSCCRSLCSLLLACSRCLHALLQAPDAYEEAGWCHSPHGGADNRQGGRAPSLTSGRRVVGNANSSHRRLPHAHQECYNKDQRLH